MSLLTIIFSKDRPLQLQATLASFRLHCQEAAATPIAVLYRASSEPFAQGYTQLMDEFRGRLPIVWVQESDFKHDLLAQIQSPLPHSRLLRLALRLALRGRSLLHGHLLFLVDDNIFIHPFSLTGVLEALEQERGTIGFSLRVGRNTTMCYSM
jgi:hypothetical protein